MQVMSWAHRGDKPAFVLSADNEIALMTVGVSIYKWRPILAPGGHNIHYEHPELVAEAILNIVNTTRQGMCHLKD